MRKSTVFGITMLLLVLMMSLIPVVKASVYIWDDVRFVEDYEGGWIKYPHPDRNHYGISPFSTKGVDGLELHHCQIDSATSITLVASVDILCGALGAYFGHMIGGTVGAVAGAVLETAFGVLITYISKTYFLDEHNCLWWWLSLSFVTWFFENSFILWWYGISNPSYALNLVLSMLFATGYLRVGAITFLDTTGIGNPGPPGPIPQYTLSISSSLGGTTEPTTGSYVYDRGTAVNVNAYPIANYYFRYWILDGVLNNDNPITVIMDSDHTLKAYFGESPYVGGGGCPILSVYDGEEYVEEGSLNIHAPEGVDTIAFHTLTVEPEPEGWSYLLRLTEPDLPDAHSFIDHIKLLAVDKSRIVKELRLIKAVHSEHGNVLLELLFSDDARAETLPYQTIDLKFLAPVGQNEVEELIFVIEGYNTKRPL